MSRHWKPDRSSDWTVIDGYPPSGSDRGGGDGVVPVVVSAVLIGLMIGGALAWTAQHAANGPSSAPEWNGVPPAPTR